MYITMDDGSWDPPSHEMMVSTRAMDMLSMKLVVSVTHQHSSDPWDTEYGGALYSRIVHSYAYC